MPKYERLKEFGILHRSKDRYVKVTLEKVTDGEKSSVYLRFYEHYKDKTTGELRPRRKDGGEGKFKQEIVSFSMPFNTECIEEFATLSKALSDYLEAEPQPSNEEDAF